MRSIVVRDYILSGLEEFYHEPETLELRNRVSGAARASRLVSLDRSAGEQGNRNSDQKRVNEDAEADPQCASRPAAACE